MTLQVLKFGLPIQPCCRCYGGAKIRFVGLPVQPCCRCYGGAKIRFTYQHNIIIFFTFLKSQAYEYHFLVNKRVKILRKTLKFSIGALKYNQPAAARRAFASLVITLG